MMTRAALAMVENIDWNVGRVLQTVDQLGLRDQTIVVYFSDNGPNSYRWNGDMKGRKGSIDEGGLRSPCFVRALYPRPVTSYPREAERRLNRSFARGPRSRSWTVYQPCRNNPPWRPQRSNPLHRPRHSHGVP